MAEQVNINIVADTSSAQKNVGNLSEEIKSAIIPSIGLVNAIEMGVDAVIEFGKASIEAYKEATDSVNKLNFALTNMGGEGEAALKRLTDQADELEGTSLFDAEAIQETQTQLITSLGLTAREVADLTPKIVELASAQGIDMAQATDQVINGLNGQEKALKKAGVEFQATGDRTKDLSNLMGGLEKFAGASAISLEKNGKGARDAEVAFGKLQEKVGGDLVNAFHDFGDAIFDTENFMNGNIATTKALTEMYDNYKATLQDVSNRIINAGDKQRDLSILYYQDIKTRRELSFAENQIYIALLKDQTAEVNAANQRAIEGLNAKSEKEKAASAKKSEQVKKELTEYEKLIAKQKELDIAITNSITAGDVDKANELSLEYKKVSEQISWIDYNAKLSKEGLKELNAIATELQQEQADDTELTVKEFIPGIGWVSPEKAAEYRQLMKDTEMALLEASAELAQAGLQILNDSLQRQTEAKLAQLATERTILDEKYNYEEEKLQNKANSERLTESQTQLLRSELNQKRIKDQLLLDKREADIKKKAFNREKAFNLIQTGITGALAITKSIAALPPPANIPGIILTSAQVAAQIAVIASQKAPAFAKGGLVSGPGTSTSDSIDAKLSNGESVINANSTSMFGPLLSAINEMGGGKAFKSESYVPSGKATQETTQPIIKTYVVDSEMTNAQKKSGRIDRLTSY